MADYTRDQLMQGLRAAHDAGDTAAASAIAGRIQSLGTAPAPVTPAAPEIAQPVSQPPLDPRTATTGDYLARLSGGLGSIAGPANDFVRSATNTFGVGDRLAAAMGGQPLANEQAQTEAANERLGPVGRGAAAMVGFGPLGKLGMGADIAKAIAPAGSGIVRSAMGSGAGTGAEASVGNWLATLGHGGSTQEAEKNAGQGALVGGIAGSILGATGQTPTDAVPGPTMAVPLPALETGMKQAFKDAGKVKIDSLDIRDAMRAARAEIAQQPSRVTDLGQGALDQIGKIEKSTMGRDARSAEDVGDYLKQLHNFKTGDDVPDAGLIAQKHLNSLLDTALPTTGQGVGAGAEALQSAKDATALYKDTKRLQKFQNKAQAGGPDIGSQAKSWLPSDKGMQFAPQGSPLNETMSTLAGTAAKGEYMPWWAKHFIVAPMVGTAVGEGLGAMTGERSPWTHIAEDAGIGLAYGLGAKGYSGLTGRTNRLAQQRAFDAAKIAASTGQMPGAAAKAAPVGDLIRRAMLGQMAAGSQ